MVAEKYSKRFQILRLECSQREAKIYFGGLGQK